MMIRVEINEIKNNKKQRQWTQKLAFEKRNQIDKPIVTVIRKKESTNN